MVGGRESSRRDSFLSDRSDPREDRFSSSVSADESRNVSAFQAQSEEGDFLHSSFGVPAVYADDACGEPLDFSGADALNEPRDVFAIEDGCSSESGSGDESLGLSTQLTLRVGRPSASFSSFAPLSASFSLSQSLCATSGDLPAAPRRPPRGAETESTAEAQASSAAPRGSSRRAGVPGDDGEIGGREAGRQGCWRRAWSGAAAPETPEPRPAEASSPGSEAPAADAARAPPAARHAERLRPLAGAGTKARGEPAVAESPQSGREDARATEGHAANPERCRRGAVGKGDTRGEQAAEDEAERLGAWHNSTHLLKEESSATFGAAHQGLPVVCILVVVEHPARGAEIRLFHQISDSCADAGEKASRGERCLPTLRHASAERRGTDSRFSSAGSCAKRGSDSRRGSTGRPSTSRCMRLEQPARRGGSPSAPASPSSCFPSSNSASAAHAALIRDWAPRLALPDVSAPEGPLDGADGAPSSPSSSQSAAASETQAKIQAAQDGRREGTVFFLLPAPDCCLFGLSCYSVIDARSIYPGASPGSRLRGAVCVVSSAPFWGCLLFRLAPVASAFFQSLQAPAPVSPSSLGALRLERSSRSGSRARQSEKAFSRLEKAQRRRRQSSSKREDTRREGNEAHAEACAPPPHASGDREGASQSKTEDVAVAVAEDLLLEWTAQVNRVRLDQMRYSELFFNLEGSLLPFFLLFPPELLLTLAKAFLLERKILFFSENPTRASSAVLAFLSLFPAALTCGFNSDGFGSLQYRWTLYGFPFHVFHQRFVLAPFLSLPLIEDVLIQKRGFLVGASNWAVRTHPVVRPDVLVDLDRVTVDIAVASLRPCLALSSRDVLFSSQSLPEALASASHRRHTAPVAAGSSSVLSSSFGAKSLLVRHNSDAVSKESSFASSRTSGIPPPEVLPASSASSSSSALSSSFSSSSSSSSASASAASSSSSFSFGRHAGEIFQQALGSLSASHASARPAFLRKQKSSTASASSVVSTPLPPSPGAFPSPPLSLCSSPSPLSAATPSPPLADAEPARDPIDWMLEGARATTEPGAAEVPQEEESRASPESSAGAAAEGRGRALRKETERVFSLSPSARRHATAEPQAAGSSSSVSRAASPLAYKSAAAASLSSSSAAATPSAGDRGADRVERGGLPGWRASGAFSQFSRAVKSFTAGLDLGGSGHKNGVAALGPPSANPVAPLEPREHDASPPAPALAPAAPCAVSPPSESRAQSLAPPKVTPGTCASAQMPAFVSRGVPSNAATLAAASRALWKRSSTSSASTSPCASPLAAATARRKTADRVADRAKAPSTADADWEASTDRVRVAFTQYLERLCRCAAVAAGPRRSASQLLAELARLSERERGREQTLRDADDDGDISDFNPRWMCAWTDTHNFQVWLRQHRLPTVRPEAEAQGEEEAVSLVPPQAGYARFVYADRDVYEGYFSKSMRHGHGVYSSRDGFRYEGEWRRDQRHGYGVLTHDKVGFVYAGQWAADKKHGEGHLYSSTERYWGGFVDNQYSGKGTYVERVGGIFYEGEFSEGLFHGLGKLRLPTFSARGEFSRGFRMACGGASPKATPHSGADASCEATFCGEWDAGQPKGVFTCVYGDGRVYTGTLKEDTLLPHGTGSMTHADDSAFEGEWRDGRRQGAGVFSAPAHVFRLSSELEGLLRALNLHEESPQVGAARGESAACVTVEGVWRDDAPAADAEWVVAFPSGDKYVGTLRVPPPLPPRAVAAQSGVDASGSRDPGEAQREPAEDQPGGASGDLQPAKEEGALEETLNNMILPHGAGLAKLKATGETYDGQWKRGRRHGEGECIASSGVRYQGEWREGRPHGEGVLTDAGGGEQRGFFRYGVFLREEEEAQHADDEEASERDEEASERRLGSLECGGDGVLPAQRWGDAGGGAAATRGDSDADASRPRSAEADRSSPVLFSAFLLYPLHLCRSFWRSSA
ncbi:MORN repeat-containing protein [Besnoitia besnoiti]|uniref:MORN repeat-containing protein n=1 Tax=Besnoitia besnoiti TaxID=94643 RepID=A0A2A9MKK3_BESBE|nr:MORN repeat-containing protein [Besnoitia besnoiti]PFH36213.1 MORN repeat-containing protein [Besnoitia besnoiti]